MGDVCEVCGRERGGGRDRCHARSPVGDHTCLPLGYERVTAELAAAKEALAKAESICASYEERLAVAAAVQILDPAREALAKAERERDEALVRVVLLENPTFTCAWCLEVLAAAGTSAAAAAESAKAHVAVCPHAPYRAALTAAQARIGRLAKYAAHATECASLTHRTLIDWVAGDEKSCSCGLAAALAPDPAQRGTGGAPTGSQQGGAEQGGGGGGAEAGNREVASRLESFAEGLDRAFASTLAQVPSAEVKCSACGGRGRHPVPGRPDQHIAATNTCRACLGSGHVPAQQADPRREK